VAGFFFAQNHRCAAKSLPDSVASKEEHGMGTLIFLVLAVVVIAGVLWGRKYFRREIERAKRINRANRRD
jgi:hypothetical protein